MSVQHLVMAYVAMMATNCSLIVSLLKKEVDHLVIQPRDAILNEGPDKKLVEEFASTLRNNLHHVSTINPLFEKVKVEVLAETFGENFAVYTLERPDPVYKIRLSWQ